MKHKFSIDSLHEDTLLPIDIFETALGWLTIETTDLGVIKTTLPDPLYEKPLGTSPKTGGITSNASTAILEEAKYRLIRYCDGEDIGFEDIPIDIDGWTAHTERARAACRGIPRGETRTYAWLAEQASGTRKAARAAARAMATNPLPLIIPCHRIIGSDGNLRGFGGRIGIPLKAKLLEIERAK